MICQCFVCSSFPDLPLPRYIWNVIKNTTTAERLSCAAALTFLFVCIILIVYFTVIAKKTTDGVVDADPEKWFVSRKMWLAPEFHNIDQKTDKYDPLRLVIIAHTVSNECHILKNCAAELINIQTYYTENYRYDLPYNFLIGNDGRVYEGRGWNVVGAHTKGYNLCSLGIGFIGDYREGLPSYSRVTPLQLERAKMLLSLGVKLHYLHPDYHVLGAKDLQSTESPGENLYKEIRKWSHYNNDNVYINKSCDDIQSMYMNQTESTSLTTTSASIMRDILSNDTTKL